jgi:peptide-methionine (S)-S-oxide reductase
MRFHKKVEMQGMRQGNDGGTQHRSGIYTFTQAQRAAAEASKAENQMALTQNGLARITTETLPAPEFFFAEDYHQHGYCGLAGTGVAWPMPTSVTAA